MAGTREASNATWFGDHSGLALFVVGCVLLLAGVVAPNRGAAATTAILFIGGGMVFVGALLPRLAGPVKVTPASIEMAVAERLDATRREARARTPGYEDQAVLRAVEVLLEQFRTAGLIPAVGHEQADPPAAAGRTAAPEVAAHRWRAVPEPPPEVVPEPSQEVVPEPPPEVMPEPSPEVVPERTAATECQPVDAPQSGALPGSPASRTRQRSTPRRVRARWGWGLAPATAVVLAVVLLTPLGWLVFEQPPDEAPGDTDRPAIPPTDAPGDEDEPVDEPDPDAAGDGEAPGNGPAEPSDDPTGTRPLRVLGLLGAAAVVAVLAWAAWRALSVRLAHDVRPEDTPPFAEAPQEFARHVVDGLVTAAPGSGGQPDDQRPH